MLVMLFLLLAADSVIARPLPAPPPEIVAITPQNASGLIAVSHSAPPPVTVAVPPAPVVATPRPVSPVRVRVTAGDKTLFDGELRTARGSGASYSETWSEAPAIDCSADRFYASGERRSLNLQLHSRDEPQTGPAVTVNVTWQRPTSSTVCPSEGSRSVSLVQTVPLAPGQTSTIRGDAGLTVTLSRR